MSESLRELERVKESLMAARRAVVIAHGMTEDLHSGVDGAGKSLAESEAMRRYATVAGEGAAAYFDSAEVRGPGSAVDLHLVDRDAVARRPLGALDPDVARTSRAAPALACPR